MDTKAIIEKFRQKFGNDVAGVEEKSPTRVIITVNPGVILDVGAYLFRNEGFRFIIATAVHTKKGFEILYHFSMDEIGLVLNIHVILDKKNPQIESLSNMFDASNWIEREMHELFGIDFLHHPNQEKLISEGNWAEGVYPYRKDFKED